MRGIFTYDRYRNIVETIIEADFENSVGDFYLTISTPVIAKLAITNVRKLV